MDDVMDDSGDGVRWLSYDELASALGIKPSSAVRLSMRRKWPRRKGNDGKARVAAPLAVLRQPYDIAHDSREDAIPDSPDDISRTVIGLEAEAAGLREALSREAQRADQAEARADRSEKDAAGLRELAEKRAEALTEALVRAAGAEGEARILREALNDARRPFWQRWLGWPS